jgi:hypothetical protein
MKISMKPIAILFTAAACTCFSGKSFGASIATIFGADNGGGFGGAIYFDITTGSNPVTITGLFTNVQNAPGDSFAGFEVRLVEGSSYAANVGDSAAWTLVSTGSGSTAGYDFKTEVLLSNSFTLNANQVYGIALINPANLQFAYTNGDGSNELYSNSDLTLTLGAADNTPFSGSPFSPRVWNGEITYTTGASVPEPAGAATMTGLIMGITAMNRRRRKA